MSKDKITCNISVSLTDMEKVKTLIDLLNENRRSLPTDLISSIDRLADCDACEINNNYLTQAGYNSSDIVVLVDGIIASGVVSVNPILKRVKIIPSKYYREIDRPKINDHRSVFEEQYIYPKSLKIESCRGNLIASWGKLCH